MKILIVEDEIFAAMHLETMVEDLGCTVVGIAPDTQSALQLAESRPDLALVDVNLRDGVTGPSIAQRLANDFGTKVLFLTASPRQIGEGFDGMIGVLTKPWAEQELASAIGRAGTADPAAEAN